MVSKFSESLRAVQQRELPSENMYPVLGALIVIALTAFLKQYLAVASLPLPPGPKPLPIIGNITQIPKDAPLQKLQEWIAIYGPAISFKFGSRTVILLGDRATTHAMMEKRFSLYGNRPRLIFLNDYLFENHLTLTMPHQDDSEFRTLSRSRAPIFSPTGAKATSRLLPAATAYCLHDMLSGGDLLDHMLMVFTRVIFPLLYGKTVDSIGPTHVRDVRVLLNLVGETISPDSSIIEMFPSLEYVPGVPWLLKRKAAALLRPKLAKTITRIDEALRSPTWNTAQGIRARCPADMTIEKFSISVIDLEVTSGAMTLVMTSIIHRTLENPDALHKVLAEMDSVVGKDRLPTLDDLPKLPYYNAFIREAMRLGSIPRVGIPRAATHDDEYMGYRIPKEAMVFPFHYGMNMDESVYENPTKFDPFRWIRDPALPKPVMFGFGKRVCPGQPFVSDTVGITLARMFWAFDFHIQKDADVQLFVDNFMIQLKSTSHIKFQCKSDVHRALVEKAYREADIDPSPMLNDLQALF